MKKLIALAVAVLAVPACGGNPDWSYTLMDYKIDAPQDVPGCLVDKKDPQKTYWGGRMQIFASETDPRRRVYGDFDICGILGVIEKLTINGNALSFTMNTPGYQPFDVKVIDRSGSLTGSALGNIFINPDGTGKSFEAHPSEIQIR